MTFEQALRRSRLSSLPKNKNKCSSGPQSQVIYTTPAANYRRNFGLKRDMPTPLKSRYITTSKLDTEHGFTDYNQTGKSLILKRLQSLNTPMQPIPRKSRERAELSPLFYGSTATKSSTLIKPSAKDYQEWLKQHNYPNDKQHCEEFVNSRSNKINNSPMATAGSLYTLPGVLRNIPQGTTNQTEFKGRPLDKSGRMIAAAGVIGVNESPPPDFGNNSSNTLARTKIQPYVIERLRIDDERISMYVNTKRSQKLGIQSRQHRSSNFVQTGNEKESKKQAQEYFNSIMNTLYV